MKHTLLLTILLIVFSCTRKNDDIPVAKPQLSHYNIELSIGDSREITVLNSQSVTSVEVPETVKVTVSGNRIIITGMSTGICDIKINADNTTLTCRAKVTEQLPPDTTETDKELDDGSTRFSSSNLTIHYSTPGTLVTVAGDSIEFRDLRSGDRTLSTRGCLIVNNEIISTSEREKVKADATTKWFRHTVKDGMAAWVIINDI